MYWWVELGYPDAFDLGKDGIFPRPGQVVKYYRERKMDDKGKAWTQKNLARTLGMTDNAVRDIENRNVGMDFERRQFLSRLFDIPPILLGIVTLGEIDSLLEKQRKANNSVVLSTASATSHKRTIDIQAYRKQLASLFAATIHREQSPLVTALASVDELYRELPHATQDQSDIQSLLCDYHQFISLPLCDQCHYDTAIEHLNKAFRFAEFGDEQKALVFGRRGLTLWKADRIDESLMDFGKAWQFEKKLPNNLRGILLLESGRARAQKAETKQERTEVLRSIDLVGGLIRGNHQEEDPHLTQLDLDCYHLYKSSVLITIGWNKEAIQELALIKGFSQYPARQVYYDILQAQAYANRGMYPDAANLIESALLTAQEVISEINIARIVKLFRHLQQSPYKDSPDVARIDYLLYRKPGSPLAFGNVRKPLADVLYEDKATDY
jgi:tetratricopeptide (TPR) repeat protein